MFSAGVSKREKCLEIRFAIWQLIYINHKGSLCCLYACLDSPFQDWALDWLYWCRVSLICGNLYDKEKRGRKGLKMVMIAPEASPPFKNTPSRSILSARSHLPDQGQIPPIPRALSQPKVGTSWSWSRYINGKNGAQGEVGVSNDGDDQCGHCGYPGERSKGRGLLRARPAGKGSMPAAGCREWPVLGLVYGSHRGETVRGEGVTLLVKYHGNKNWSSSHLRREADWNAW